MLGSKWCILAITRCKLRYQQVLWVQCAGFFSLPKSWYYIGSLPCSISINLQDHPQVIICYSFRKLVFFSFFFKLNVTCIFWENRGSWFPQQFAEGLRISCSFPMLNSFFQPRDLNWWPSHHRHSTRSQRATHLSWDPSSHDPVCHPSPGCPDGMYKSSFLLSQPTPPPRPARHPLSTRSMPDDRRGTNM